jgi:hypothetical protein
VQRNKQQDTFLEPTSNVVQFTQGNLNRETLHRGNETPFITKIHPTKTKREAHWNVWCNGTKGKSPCANWTENLIDTKN